MRNPNGYGSVCKLSGKRRRPYIVKKVKGWDKKGYPIYDIIGYAKTREEGNILLAEYNRSPWNIEKANITVKELFELWKEKKAPKLGTSNKRCLISAFKHCHSYSNFPYRKIRPYHMQDTIDNCGKGASVQSQIKSLWKHLNALAIETDITFHSYADLLSCESTPESNRLPFSDKEIETLWAHKDDPWVDTVLIFIYTGWRITELLGMESKNVDLAKGFMTGGVKTKAGKNRMVPIHSKIRKLVENRLADNAPMLITNNGGPVPVGTYREYWRKIMTDLGFMHGDHLPVPHEARHTLETKLDNAKANRKCIDMIMGHASKDIGNRVYNHKTLEDLKEAIEMID